MKLYEFQGKEIFKKYDIRIPDSQLLLSADDQIDLNLPAVLKAQVLVGGRGKAGGIKIASKNEEISGLLKELFATKIKGEKVSAILCEEKAQIDNEFYISITYNKVEARPVLIASAAGGVNIEEVAKNTPEKIITLPFDIFAGPADYQIRYIAKAFGYKNIRDMGQLINKLYNIFVDYDATLVEINPLAQTPAGLMALDSKILLDGKAVFRQKEVFAAIEEEQASIEGKNKIVEETLSDTITFVPLDGTVGMISDGAGTGMLSLDLINDAGGEAASFCEMGGMTNPDVMYEAIETVFKKKPDIKSLLIVLIGGFNRMDEMAEGIVKYKEEHGFKVPVVVRMCGTLEEVGKETMGQANIPTHDNLLEAVKEAVEFAGGGN